MTLLLQDPRLEHLEMAWSPDAMVRFFDSEVLPAVLPGRTVETLALEDVTYRPGRTCIVRYAVALDGESAQRWVLVTFSKPRRIERARSYYHNGGRTGEGPLPAPAVVLPQYQCFVEFFPADWVLPGLPDALDPDAVAGALPAANGARRADIITYVPHRRCVVRYRFGEEELIGKVYPRGTKAGEVWLDLTDLYAQAGAGGVLPRPVAFLDAWQLVVTGCAQGAPLNQTLLRDGPGAPGRVAGLAARTLAALHRLEFQSAQRRTLGSEIEHVAKRAERLAVVAPELAAQVHDLLARASRLADSAPPYAATFVHGDFKASQLIVDGDRAVVVDFDKIACGDPAHDAGNFAADLRRLAVRSGHDGLRELEEAFLTAYAALAPQAGLEERARLVQAVVLCRMAMRAFRHGAHEFVRDPSSSLPARLLQEATACLARL